MAYSPDLAAALSGATLRQLGHWRRETSSGAVLAPEVSDRRPILYSFRDVVALRTCVYLRKDSPLQRVRLALENLRSLGELGHLSEYTLVSDGGSIVLVKNDQAIDLVRNPGQYVIAEMSDVLRPFINRNQVQVPALYRPREGIVVDPEVRSGHPVIAGTRVPYENVAELVADGVPAREIENYYPSVDAQAAEDAWDFAKYVDSWRPRERRRQTAIA
jgi:uncharacterized protein (DUF433 family)